MFGSGGRFRAAACTTPGAADAGTAGRYSALHCALVQQAAFSPVGAAVRSASRRGRFRAAPSASALAFDSVFKSLHCARPERAANRAAPLVTPAPLGAPSLTRWLAAVVGVYAAVCVCSVRLTRREASFARAAERVWRLRLLPGLAVEVLFS